MADCVDGARRRLLGAAAYTLASAKLGALGALTPYPGEAAASDVRLAGTQNSFAFGRIRQIIAGPLEVGYAEEGPEDGPPVLLLHGWPYDIHAYSDVAPLLARRGYRVLVPFVRGHGTTRFLSPQTMRNGQQAALASDAIAFLDALSIPKAIVAGFDWGARTANIVAAMWPDRCTSMVAVSGYLIGNRDAGRQPLSPQEELSWWYQFYFATERGRVGYELHRRAFARLIWKLASPEWAFDDDTFERTATAFDNPDHVSVVIHNYRWRLGLADGEAQYDAIERRLASAPEISVPSVTLEGDANGAPHPDSSRYATKFTGGYVHRIVGGGIGHNLPQEAPLAFADAVLDSVNL